MNTNSSKSHTRRPCDRASQAQPITLSTMSGRLSGSASIHCLLRCASSRAPFLTRNSDVFLGRFLCTRRDRARNHGSNRDPDESQNVEPNGAAPMVISVVEKMSTARVCVRACPRVCVVCIFVCACAHHIGYRPRSLVQRGHPSPLQNFALCWRKYVQSRCSDWDRSARRCERSTHFTTYNK